MVFGPKSLNTCVFQALGFDFVIIGIVVLIITLVTKSHDPLSNQELNCILMINDPLEL